MMQNIKIDPSMLRLLWQVIEKISYQELLALNDRELTQFIIQGVADRIVLGTEETHHISRYISANLLMIRDFADAA